MIIDLTAVQIAEFAYQTRRLRLNRGGACA